MRKPVNSITKESYHWKPQGKRNRKIAKNTHRGELETRMIWVEFETEINDMERLRDR